MDQFIFFAAFFYFFFAVLFFCCLIEFDRQSLVEAQVFLTALRPGPVEIWVEAAEARSSSDSSLRVAPGRSRHVARVSRSALTRNCELEDVYFSPKGGMIPVRQSHVHRVGRCWKKNHKLQIFVNVCKTTDGAVRVSQIWRRWQRNQLRNSTLRSLSFTDPESLGP